jgi:thymidylate kinase
MVFCRKKISRIVLSDFFRDINLIAMFITIYGVNNIGKSTQVSSLVENLNKAGIETQSVKYPVYDVEPTGPRIDYYLRDPQAPKISAEELQMWYTLNRFQVQPILEEGLKKGVTVVAEDYIGTGIAWGITHGADKEWLQSINRYLKKEDLAILLDGDQFQTEREEQHINEASDELIDKCRQVHLELVEEYGWKIVNANRDKDAIAKEIFEIVKAAGI